MFVRRDDHAARDPEIACQRPRRRKDGSGRQAALLDRRPQLLLQLHRKTTPRGPVERHKEVRRKAWIGRIGLFKNIWIGP